VAKLTLATNKKYQDRAGQWQEKVQWHRLTLWEKLADLVEEYVQKGDRLYIEGEIEYSQTEDDKGQVRYYTDIVVRELIMLGSPSGSDDRAGDRQHQQRQQPARGRAQAPQRGGARPVKRVAPAGAARSANPFDTEDEDVPV
jgi:single-strand DNA-binding protein